MATFRDKGLVLREHPAGERDKRLGLILLDRGRVTAFAKGAAAPASKFHASAQTFAFSEFMFYEGPNYLTVAGCELVEGFHGVRRDFERLCLASHVLELADRMLLENVACQDELRLIYLALGKLAGDYPPWLAAVVFELKLYQLAGFSPVSGRCHACEKPLRGGFFTYSGLTCDACAKNLPAVPVSPAAAHAISHILEADLKHLFAFTVAHDAVIEMVKALDLFRRQILDYPPKSLSLLRAF